MPWFFFSLFPLIPFLGLLYTSLFYDCQLSKAFKVLAGNGGAHHSENALDFLRGPELLQYYTK